MSDAFDPYYEWLGIQPQEQPVNYYRLLALNLYEPNLQVIANAADRQISFIRTFQTGAHSQESQAILNEISKARVTLLNETRKREYDNNLKGQVFQGEIRSEAPPFSDTLPVSDTPSVPGTSPVFPANGFAPIQPSVAGSRNSMPPKSGTVFDSQQLRLKAEIQRLEAAEKAKRSLILKIGAVGSGVLVLLTILVLIMSFSRSPSTPVSPSGHEEGLADTNQKTTQAIEKPTDVVEIPTEKSGRKRRNIEKPTDVVEIPTEKSGRKRRNIEKPTDVVEIPTSAEKPSASPLRAGNRMVKTVSGVEFAFRWCPAGTFTMGSPEDEEGRWYNETQHEVTLSQGFWMLETEVTQRQWQAIMGKNPSYFKGDNLPVECVSWDDCQEFCKKFNSESGLQIGLPTEAQWEYACRAGTTTAYNFGTSLNGDKANCNGNYPCGTTTKGKYLEKTTPVGSYSANAWGLYDMHGNVYEWCSDRDGDYPSGSVTDPTGASSGTNRVIRGGGWNFNARYCRSASRYADSPGNRYGGLGFRPVFVLFVP